MMPKITIHIIELATLNECIFSENIFSILAKLKTAITKFSNSTAVNSIYIFIFWLNDNATVTKNYLTDTFIINNRANIFIRHRSVIYATMCSIWLENTVNDYYNDRLRLGSELFLILSIQIDKYKNNLYLKDTCAKISVKT